MPQPPEVDAVAEQVLRAYREAQEELDRLTLQAVQSPNASRLRARLTELRKAVDQSMATLEALTRTWLMEEFPAVYAIGARAAATTLGTQFAWTMMHQEAVQRLATDTFSDLLKSTRFVRTDAKRYIREAAKRRSELVLTTGQTARQGGRDLARQLAEQGTEALGRPIRGVRYSNGAHHTLADYADTVVRTTTAKAYNEGTTNQSEADGITEMLCLDGSDCGLRAHDDPEKANGQVYPVETARLYPLSHPRCVMPGQRMASYGRLDEMQRAWFSGSAVVLTATTGAATRDLAVGPHHPVLTRAGWKPAHLVREGDELIYDLRCENSGDAALEAHLQQMPMVEDLFAAVRVVGTGAHVPASSDDLHGDAVFCEGEIEVVRPTRNLLLVGDPSGVQHGCEGHLMGPNPHHEVVSAGCIPHPALTGDRGAAGGIVGRFEEGGSLFGGGLFPAEQHRLTSGAADAGIAQHLPHARPCCAEPFGDLIAPESFIDVEPNGLLVVEAPASACGGTEPRPGCLARLAGVRPPASCASEGDHHFIVATVRNMRSEPYEGWVYDATTSEGMFNIGGFVVKNCRRSWTPYLPENAPDAAAVRERDPGPSRGPEPAVEARVTGRQLRTPRQPRRAR